MQRQKAPLKNLAPARFPAQPQPKQQQTQQQCRSKGLPLQIRSSRAGAPRLLNIQTSQGTYPSELHSLQALPGGRLVHVAMWQDDWQLCHILIGRSSPHSVPTLLPYC